MLLWPYYNMDANRTYSQKAGGQQYSKAPICPEQNLQTKLHKTLFAATYRSSYK